MATDPRARLGAGGLVVAGGGRFDVARADFGGGGGGLAFLGGGGGRGGAFGGAGRGDRPGARGRFEAGAGAPVGGGGRTIVEVNAMIWSKLERWAICRLFSMTGVTRDLIQRVQQQLPR